MDLGKLAQVTSPRFASKLWRNLWRPYNSPIEVVVGLEGMDVTEDGRRLRLGCRTGPEATRFGLLHEMSHFVEIDDARMLRRGWGLTLPEVYIPGRYARLAPVPETMQATERELRVSAYQWHLSKFLDVKISAAEMVSALRWMPDFTFVPGGYSHNDSKRLRWCRSRMLELTQEFTLDRFMAEWERKTKLLRERLS